MSAVKRGENSSNQHKSETPSGEMFGVRDRRHRLLLALRMSLVACTGCPRHIGTHFLRIYLQTIINKLSF